MFRPTLDERLSHVFENPACAGAEVTCRVVCDFSRGDVVSHKRHGKGTVTFCNMLYVYVRFNRYKHARACFPSELNLI